jgi:hypothetical protein
MYLAAIIDWHSKAILSYKLSNSMDVTLVTDVLDFFQNSLMCKGVKETLHLDPQRTLIPLRIRVPHHCPNHQQK